MAILIWHYLGRTPKKMKDRCNTLVLQPVPGHDPLQAIDDRGNRAKHCPEKLVDGFSAWVKMVIFNSYVSLPEGISHKIPWKITISHGFPMVFP